MSRAAGTSACESVREADAIVRKIMDMQSVNSNEMSRKKKYGPLYAVN